MKKERIKISIAILLALLFFGIFLWQSGNTVGYSPPLETKALTQKVNKAPTLEKPKAEIEIKAGTATTLEIEGIKYQTNISDPQSVEKFMDQLATEKKITYKYRIYTGLGKLVEEINGKRNGNSKYWIYEVNGAEAQVGISNYQINPGDTVSWEYEESY